MLDCLVVPKIVVIFGYHDLDIIAWYERICFGAKREKNNAVGDTLF